MMAMEHVTNCISTYDNRLCGPQCEQFCRPTQGLSALGVQHIVCGNAVGDMLHCHHSGVRI
ncbi:hypothetical protein CRE_21453 [Caenorhabditis remanei]|uniref:Domain of unknown function DB domain-containing protein n=1 Tax=Caenorhabditis remanei TaxID=31234 RepID=E3N3Q4_CAERE|nr:hypothetical protein CRE_21453 [Caenorhabditis remanei]